MVVPLLRVAVSNPAVLIGALPPVPMSGHGASSVSVPQTPGRVLEDSGPLGVPRLGVLIGFVFPARVGDDHLVCQRLKAVVDDDHLEGFIGGEVPQCACEEENKASQVRHTQNSTTVPSPLPKVILYAQVFSSSVWIIMSNMKNYQLP